MIVVFNFKDGLKYNINADQVNVKEGSNLFEWLEKGKRNNSLINVTGENRRFKDLKSVEILIHERIKYVQKK